MKNYKCLFFYLFLTFFYCIPASAQNTEKMGRSFWDAIPISLTSGEPSFTDIRDSDWHNYSCYPYYYPEDGKLYNTYGSAIFYRLNLEYTSDITIHNWESPEVNCSTIFVVAPNDPYTNPGFNYNCDSVHNAALFLGGVVEDFESLNAPPGTSCVLGYLHVNRLSPGTYYIITAGSTYMNGSVPNGLIRTTVTATACSFEYDDTDYTCMYNSVSTLVPTVAGDTLSAFSTTGNYRQKIQYYDGLGRPVQNLSYRSSPDGEDLISHQEYDILGRDWRQWLPVPQPSKEIASFVSDENLKHKSGLFYRDSCACDYLVYDGSPLNQIKESYGSGKPWHASGHSVKNAYRTNMSADSCFFFHVSGTREHPVLSSSGQYEIYSLSIVETQDEDGARNCNFVDNLGHTILERSIADNDTLDTYYVYDDYGNLCYVLPPAASDSLPYLLQTEGAYQDIVDKYTYQYRYNYRNQCTSKKLPGCDRTSLVYDMGGRTLFFQSGNQKQQGEWSFQFVDLHDRIALSGLYHGTLNVDSCYSSNVYVTFEPEKSSSQYGYVIHCPQEIALDSLQVLKANYYDTYSYKNHTFGFNPSLDYVSDETYSKQYINNNEGSTHCNGLLTGSITCLLENNQKLYGCYYYDYNHNLIQSRCTNINIKNQTLVNKSAFNFNGLPTITCEEYGEDIQVQKGYTYDHEGRLTEEIHVINNDTTRFAYSFDEIGRVKQLTRIHETDSLATTNSYNIRSWLTQIDSPVFKQQLHYTDGIGTPCYNGNISSMTWQANGESATRGYQFSYDGFSRLKNAIYGEGSNLSQNIGRFNEQVTDYDKMGNIRGLLRYGQSSESGYALLDNLNLTYDGNHLQSVYDNATNTAFGHATDFTDGAQQRIEYIYDRNGNLTQDLNKKLSNVQYNCLNLPSRIQFEDGSSISYLYDANGTKLRTAHIINGDTLTTAYCGNAIYENGVPTKLITAYGYISLNDNKYHYFIQDHQGNNRMIVEQNRTVEETNHYYPFGGVFASNSSVQPYKYNGKELDRSNGLDWYDYGARHYDAAIGRWHAVDPSSEKYYGITPYAYCANNPVNCIDPNGKDWYSSKKDGSHYWQEGNELLQGYTNIGSSASIQLGKNFYFNAYQNAGIMANQAVNAFDLIYSSAKLQNQFLGRSSPLSENSKSELFNAINNRAVNEIGKPIGEAITYALAGEAAGILAGKAISWGIGKIAGAMVSKATIQFGNNANQVYHTFRHVDDLGIDRNIVMSAIEKHVNTIIPQIVSGTPCNQIINVAGKNIQYTAYRLSNGVINIGRIHGIK